MDSSVYNAKILALNNLATCVYLPAIIFVLDRTGNLYSIGRHSTYLEMVLFVAEVIKYLKYCMALPRSAKKADQRRLKNFLKSIPMLLTMASIFYIAAVLFGAPILTEQRETASFAIMLTILSVLPCCLHLGAESVPILFTSLMSYEAGEELYQKFLLNIRLTTFGAWLGAVLIPLDWDRPYQDWPIPCCLGAIAGCFLGNLALFILYCLPPPKKTGKYHL